MFVHGQSDASSKLSIPELPHPLSGRGILLLFAMQIVGPPVVSVVLIFPPGPGDSANLKALVRSLSFYRYAFDENNNCDRLSLYCTF